MYSEPEKNLSYLVSSLPELKNLDLSGTNLVGLQEIQEVSHRPGVSRMDDDKEERHD